MRVEAIVVRGHIRISLVRIVPAVVKNTTEEVFIVGRHVDLVAEGVAFRQQFGKDVEHVVELAKRSIKEEMNLTWDIFNKIYRMPITISLCTPGGGKTEKVTIGDVGLTFRQIVEKMGFDARLKEIYYDEKIFDIDTHVVDSGVEDGDTVYILDKYDKLDERLGELLNLKRQSELYREVKLYMSILKHNSDTILNRDSKSNRVKRDVHIPENIKHRLEILRETAKIDELHFIDIERSVNNPCATYYTELVKFLESCDETYVRHKMETLVEKLGLDCPSGDNCLRHLIVDAKYGLSVTGVISPVVAEEVSSYMNHLFGMSCNLIPDLCYYSRLKRLSEVVGKNRANGLKPVSGEVYHDIKFYAMDLSDYIEDDPYWMMTK